MKSKLLIAIIAMLLSNSNQAQIIQKEIKNSLKTENKKVKILNIGVFHMGHTSDANSTKYDEASKKSKQEINEINKAIAKFKPTIILVEEQPKYQQNLEEAYRKYLQNKNTKTDYENSETQLLAFEIGRLTNVKRIIGIDHKMSYNYNMYPLAKKLNSQKFFKTGKLLNDLQNSVIKDVEKIGLKKMLLLMNTDEAYNFLININADMLMFANSKDKFEGADEASKFYHRNIRMFANINKIEMSVNDRVLIISGATHAAFFNKLIKRSMVYDLVSLSNYLK